jgi:polyhydroxyalkanoate synthesis regulator phasin
MAFESVRSYVQLASGLGEMTKARALEAAQGLLALPGADEVTRRAVQASTLADQLLEAAKANRDNLVALVQAEVEAALKRADVARLADVEAARTSLAALTREIADLRSTVLAAGVSAVSTASRTPLGSLGRPTTGAVSTRTARMAEEAADRLGVAEVGEAVASAAASGGVSTRAGAPRSAATKAAATKSTATKAAAKKSTAKKSAATKATATKKSAAKKSASTPSASTRSAAKATAPSAAKKSAAKRSTARKASAKKSAAKRSTAKKSSARKSTTGTNTTSTSATGSTATKAAT